MPKPFRVFAVDDAPEILNLLRLILERDGFDVVTAHHAPSALRSIREMHPDAILLDVNLPEVNGFELCRRLREVTDVPIIFVSARDAPEDIAQGLALGGDDYVVKPFERVDLLERLRTCLVKAGKRIVPEPVSLRVPDRADAPRYLDPEALIPRVTPRLAEFAPEVNTVA